MFCPKCGKKREDTWILCPFCGTKLPNQKNDSTRNISDLYPEFNEIDVSSKKTLKSLGRRSMLCTVTEKIDELLFSPLTPSTHTQSNVSPESKEIRVTEKTATGVGRRSMLGTLTEKMEELFSTGNTKNTQSKFRKEVKVTDLGKTYCFLMLELTEGMFNNTKMMNELGIRRTNESIKEFHILSYYLMVRTIFDSFIDDKIKKSLISVVYDRYIGLIIDYHREKKEINDISIYREIQKYKCLMNDRLNSYDEVFYKIKNKDLSSNLEGGKIFINTLKKILPPKNSENVNDIIPFNIFFTTSLNITKKITDIDSYRIVDVSFQEKFEDSYGEKCEVSIDKNGRLQFRFSE